MNVWFISNCDAAFATFIAQFLRKGNNEKDKLKDPRNISRRLKIARRAKHYHRKFIHKVI